ncbi:MAG: hypothetical protein ACSHWZ_06090 [Sulfitobacter sp.]
MTDLKTDLKKLALVSTLAVAPFAAMAGVQSGSPEQSVAEDPDEYSVEAPVAGGSMEDTPKANQGENAYQDADIVADDPAKGSLVEDDAKADG